jgi:hypothetical protein
MEKSMATMDSNDGGARPTPIRDASALAGILLQTAQSAGIAGFIIATKVEGLPILERNSVGAGLIPSAQDRFAEAGCFARMTFHDLHSHLLLVAVSGETHCGQLTLLGDPLASRRRAAILIVPVGDPEDRQNSGKVMLLIGAPLSWLEDNNWSVTSEHPAETILRLCEQNNGPSAAQ